MVFCAVRPARAEPAISHQLRWPPGPLSWRLAARTSLQAFAPDGETVAVGGRLSPEGGGAIRVHHVGTGTQVGLITETALLRMQHPRTRRRVLVSAFAARQVRELQQSDVITCVAFSSDGCLFVRPILGRRLRHI